MEVRIDHELSGSKGRYVAHVANTEAVAELTYSRLNPALIIVDHTQVPGALRGRGLGAMLAEKVVTDARVQNCKIVPLCPFFKAQADRHHEWNDVVQR